MYKQQRNKTSGFLEALSWTSRTTKNKEYIAPKNLWEEFLYALSYSRGTLVADTETRTNAAKTARYRELITQATTVSIPEAPLVIAHRNRADTRSAITKISPLTPEPAQ